MKVIITEKPSVAKEIAAALNIFQKSSDYIYNDQFYITWAYGHLIELCPPDHYGWTGQWNAGQLPMIPDKFQTRIAHKFNPKTKLWFIDARIKKQIDTIESLFNKSESIIVATDAGREGELIFRYIYQFLNCKKPFQRLWLNSLTKEAISKAFIEIKPGANYNNLFYAAKARNEADWLVGMNSSRALSIIATGHGTFSLGRVQTPTLSIICNRFIEHISFVPQLYYQVKILLSKDGISFYAITERIDDKQIAEAIFVRTQKTDSSTVTHITTREIVEQPPFLHDLTSLQREANRIHAISADETLKVAQSLYEQQFITYPRTGSCNIPEDVFQTIPRLLTAAEEYPDYHDFAVLLKDETLNKKSVNNSKVTDHHALLITNKIPNNLTGNHKLIYSLIISRFIQAFSPACLKSNTKLSLSCSDTTFLSSGSIIKEPGWRLITQTDSKKEIDEEDKEQTFPLLATGETLLKEKQEMLSKETKPKPLLTEDTLLGAMETCGKDIEDETLKESLKDCGLGTPATRASIIETLLHRRYIERDKKYLVPTPRGITIYNLLKDKKIASPELTGSWEQQLSHINLGIVDANSFMTETKKYTKEITSQILNFKNELQTSDLSDSNKEQTVCPKCQTGFLIKGKKNHYCSNYKNGCDFVLWNVVAGKTLTEKQVTDLATKKQTSVIKGFTSKLGKPFNASLVLTPVHKVTFNFPNS